jgi:hypothetical protein
MPRPRTNDPQGVSDHPVLAADPERIERIKQEFRWRLSYDTGPPSAAPILWVGDGNGGGIWSDHPDYVDDDYDYYDDPWGP